MKVSEHERRDWIIIVVIILIGFMCVFLVGYWAVRFPPSWELAADMGSKLDPNSDFLTRRPGGFVEPVDSIILTQPVWINVILTPGALFPTRIPHATTTAPLFITPTPVTLATQTTVILPSPTRTPVYYLPASTLISNPSYTRTPIFTSTALSTAIITAVPTNTAVTTTTNTPTAVTPPEADLQITKDDNATTYVSNGTLTYTVTVANSGPSAVFGAVIADNIPSQVTSWSWACSSQNSGASGCDPVSNSSVDFSDMVNLPNGASMVYTVTANISPSASGELTNNGSISPPTGITDLIMGNNSASDTDQIVVSSSFPNGNIDTIPDGQIETIPRGASVTLAFKLPLYVGDDDSWDLVMYELANGTGIAMDLIQLEISDGYNWYTILNWGDNVADTNSNMDISDATIGGVEKDNRDFTTIPKSDVLFPFGTGTLASPATGVVMELDGFVPDGNYNYIRITCPLDGMDGGCEVDAIAILP
ncbi:MAG: DUF11 domain-containing protein [Chloroflexota bacterium]